MAGLWHMGHSAYLHNCNCLFPPLSSLVAKKLSTFDYMTQRRHQKTPARALSEKKELSFPVGSPQVRGVLLLHYSYYVGLRQCQGQLAAGTCVGTIL